MATTAAMVAGLTLGAAGADAAEPRVAFEIPPQSLQGALLAYGRATNRQIVFSGAQLGGRRSEGLRGPHEPTAALDLILADSGLVWRRASSGALVIQAGDVPQPGAAAENANPEPAQALAEVVVTGTHIRGIDPITPVEVIDRDEIERSGAIDVGQVLQKVTANFGGGFTAEATALGALADFAAENRTRGTSPNLLGLGSASTLVLLNGHRLPPAGNGLAVDTSMVPAAALQRVEVMADGASSIYGADAVAGVVNLVTRRTYDGIETRARYGGAPGGLETVQASLFGGGSWSETNAVFGVQYLQTATLAALDRAPTRLATQPYRLFGDVRTLSAFAAAEHSPREGIRLTLDALVSQRLTNDQYTSSATSVSDNGNRVRQASLSAGLEVKLPRDWVLDATATANRNFSAYATGQYLRTGPLQFDVSRRDRHELYSLDLIGSGPVFPTPAGAASLAVGASYRDERSRARTVTLNGTGALLSSSRADPQRHVTSAFAELDLPLVPAGRGVLSQARLSLSGRYDHYSDFGGVFAPRVAASLEPLPGLRLFGSYSESFRAPSSWENSGNFTGIVNDVLDGAGRTRILYLQGNGRPLEAERATNYSLGLRFKPDWAPGVSLEASYFNVHYTDRIADPDPSGLFITDIRAVPPSILYRNAERAFVDTLFRGASNVTSRVGTYDLAAITTVVDGRNTNVSETQAEGVQAEARYARRLGEGELSVSSQLIYYLDLTDTLTEVSAPVQRVDRAFSPARWRARTGVSWTGDRAGASLWWNHVDGYSDLRLPATPLSVGAWDTIDASLQYNLGAWAGGRETRLVLSAQNLLDRSPPYVRPTFQGFSWDATNASIVGRFVSLELVRRW